jgi:hypothetical protein
MRKDDLLLFGPYRWRVLAVEDHGALIITEEIIALRWYHHAFVDVTWAECALRHYLNHAFCYAFGPAEQATILAVANANPDNPWFGTPGGQRPRTASFCSAWTRRVRILATAAPGSPPKAAKPGAWTTNTMSPGKPLTGRQPTAGGCAPRAITGARGRA